MSQTLSSTKIHPVAGAHLVMVLDYVVTRATEGYALASIAKDIDRHLPGYQGTASSAVLDHALDIGLLTELIRAGRPHEIRVNAPALQLLGLDADQVFGSWHHEMAFVLHLYRLHAGLPPEKRRKSSGRAWRPVASLIEFLQTGKDIWWFHDVTSRPIADPHRRHDSEMYWKVEVDVGAALAVESGLLLRPDPDSNFVLDYRITEAGTAWLAGHGAEIAKSVREIELRGVL